jgi:rare lipoprotein A (peptidoglycan hydrolase)
MTIRPRTITALLAFTALALLSLAGAAGVATAATGGASAPSTGSATASPAHRIHATGIATWFGPGFYGQETACGQTLTPAVVGLANRTLPCGTLIRITYRGRAVTMPVIDRGPYSFADWDLTAGAAQALGVTETVRIGTRVVGRAPNTPTLGLPAVAASATVAGGAVAG